MFKQILKRFFEWIFISAFLMLLVFIINDINWILFVTGALIGYLICLLLKVPYNRKEIELDEYIEKHNKNGFD